jgi:hypothetical protein
VEKRSKKKHEANASISIPQTQATIVFEDQNKDIQKTEKSKLGITYTSGSQDNDPSQPTPKVIREEDRSEKKKKRKIKKTSSSSDDYQVDHSNTGAGEVSSSKRQKTVSESHKPVSFLRFSQHT